MVLGHPSDPLNGKVRPVVAPNADELLVLKLKKTIPVGKFEVGNIEQMVMGDRRGADGAIENPEDRKSDLWDFGAGDDARCDARSDVVQTTLQDRPHQTAEDNRRWVENIHECDDTRRKLA